MSLQTNSISTTAPSINIETEGFRKKKPHKKCKAEAINLSRLLKDTFPPKSVKFYPTCQVFEVYRASDSEEAMKVICQVVFSFLSADFVDRLRESNEVENLYLNQETLDYEMNEYIREGFGFQASINFETYPIHQEAAGINVSKKRKSFEPCLKKDVKGLLDVQKIEKIFDEILEATDSNRINLFFRHQQRIKVCTERLLNKNQFLFVQYSKEFQLNISTVIDHAKKICRGIKKIAELQNPENWLIDTSQEIIKTSDVIIQSIKNIKSLPSV